MIPQNIVVMCEGNAENALLDILIDNNLLIFTREEMFKESVIQGCRDFRSFQDRHLEGTKVTKKLVIYRVQDDLPKKIAGHEVVPKREYQDMIEEVRFVITRPEIEMLMIIYNELEDVYQKYIVQSRSRRTPKPSSFLKTVSKDFKKCKEYDFVYDHFSNQEKLCESIRKYSLSIKHKNVISEYPKALSLWDLLKLS